MSLIHRRQEPIGVGQTGGLRDEPTRHRIVEVHSMDDFRNSSLLTDTHEGYAAASATAAAAAASDELDR